MTRSVAGGAVLVVLAIAGCAPTASTTGITVTVTGDRCSVAPASAESGSVLFTVVNSSEEVASVEILSTGTSLGGIGNIAPDLSRDVVLELATGDYVLECTSGPASVSGTADFTVTDSGGTVAPPTSAEGAGDFYRAWVADTSTELRNATAELGVAFVADDPAAQQRYREARALWASLRAAVQRFPELLPSIDARESDLVVGERLSGWHAIEKDLWPPANYAPLDAAERLDLSAALQDSLAALLDRVEGASAMEAPAIATGAQELMDAASRALSDGDERWSHAERWLVQGYLDGSMAAVDALRPVLEQDSPDLLAQIDQRGASLQAALDAEASTRGLAACIDSLATALSMIPRDARIEP